MHLMTVRTKIILLIIAVITALATVFAATYKPKRVEIIGSPLIKVKALLPLSGPDEHLGNAARRGFEAMLRQAAQTQTRYRYDVVYEDAAAPISDDGAYKAVVSAGLMPEPQIILKLQDQPAHSYVFSHAVSGCRRQIHCRTPFSRRPQHRVNHSGCRKLSRTGGSA